VRGDADGPQGVGCAVVRAEELERGSSHGH
jgi:hypothetical protein